MSDKGEKPKSSKTDELIEEAVAELDGTLVQGPLVDELTDPSEPDEIKVVTPKKEAVATIDVQQYVEKEAYMRLAADFDNFRKRALKERQEWEQQGQEKVFQGFLEVLDNLVRGLDQAANDQSALAEGMRMVLSQAENWMKSEGLERISSLGEKFDPSVHDAVASVEDASKEDGVIVEEIRRGYKFKDRLLRPAGVIVVKNTSREPTE